MPSVRVVPVPCLKDNFAYLVIEGDRAAVVDPSEAAPIEAALAREGVTLAAIWATHHHWDHTGGIGDLAAKHPGVDVVIGETDAAKTKHVTRTVKDGDELVFGPHRVRVIHNPGHTLGAVTYLVDGCAFTGDTLFAAGCGRVFEGDPAMMHASLMRLAALPPETRVYFGHEYTAANLRFAAAVEPQSEAVAKRAAALPSPSTPSTIGEERVTNPFLRAAEPAVIASARAQGAAADDPVSVFAAIRDWKNRF
ncbi:MAG TPA: hydroxyacylglutathione hydrolase [Kofleriaceae bacterium]|nr:hydroxyacylglutathione hydrolase [Kofleriaceae bacterium]